MFIFFLDLEKYTKVNIFFLKLKLQNKKFLWIKWWYIINFMFLDYTFFKDKEY